MKARDKNLAKDPDFYRKIGAIGGRNGRTGGFAAYVSCNCTHFSGVHNKAQCAGKIGGSISRRKSKYAIKCEKCNSIGHLVNYCPYNIGKK